MAFPHCHFNSQGQYGAPLRSGLNQEENGHNLIAAAFDCMTQMRSGDGTQLAHYTEVKDRYGFPDEATAQSAYNEINSYLIGMQAVEVTRTQLFNKLRG